MNLLTEQKQTHRLREQTCSEGECGRDRLGVWDWHVHTTMFKTDNQQQPTV